MNQYDLERQLITDVTNGDVYEFTAHISREDLEEELAELLFTWSTFRTDPAKLAAAMSRHIAGMACRAAKDKATCDFEIDEEEEAMYRGAVAYQEWKDRKHES